LFCEIHIEIGVGLEIIEETPLDPEIEISSFDGFEYEIEPLRCLGLDDSPQGFDPDVALFEVGRGDFEGAVVVALVDELQFPAEELVGVVDVALVDLPQVDGGAGEFHRHVLHLAHHAHLPPPSVQDLHLQGKID
jgi:hypothetical protein